MHGEEQAKGLTVGVVCPVHELVEDGQHPALELLLRGLVEGEGEAAEPMAASGPASSSSAVNASSMAWLALVSVARSASRLSVQDMPVAR